MNPPDEINSNLARAEESLAAAQLLLDSGYPDFAASRAYYAAFYAATALLLSVGAQFGKHSGVIAAVHKRFVKTGKLSQEEGKNLTWLFELRGLGDYGETRHVTPQEAASAIPAARRFVSAVRTLISF